MELECMHTMHNAIESRVHTVLHLPPCLSCSRSEQRALGRVSWLPQGWAARRHSARLLRRDLAQTDAAAA